MAEYWDLYDENRQPLGKKALRGSMKPMSGEYHVAVMIVTMNSHGKLLCTLRSKDKDNGNLRQALRLRAKTANRRRGASFLKKRV